MTDQAGPPRWGNRLTRTCARFLLNLAGWSFDGELPRQPKMVIVVAPHTSNWDFILGILAIFALGIRAHWIGKHTIFKPPLGRLMTWLGGIPVNRSVPNDLVNATTEKFEQDDKLLIGIAPEGTRTRVETWKRGFYRIASGAGVPILCAALDYRQRNISFGPLLMPSGDFDHDFVQIRNFYADKSARHPEKFHLPE